MTDETRIAGQLLVWCFEAVFLSLLLWCAYKAARDAWRRAGEAEMCERVGRDQVRGVVERLSMADVRERAEGRG